MASKFNSIVEAVDGVMNDADDGISIASAVQNAAQDGDYRTAILEGLETLVGMAELGGKEVAKKAPVLSLAVTFSQMKDAHDNYKQHGVVGNSELLSIGSGIASTLGGLALLAASPAVVAVGSALLVGSVALGLLALATDADADSIWTEMFPSLQGLQSMYGDQLRQAVLVMGEDVIDGKEEAAALLALFELVTSQQGSGNGYHASAIENMMSVQKMASEEEDSLIDGLAIVKAMAELFEVELSTLENGEEDYLFYPAIDELYTELSGRPDKFRFVEYMRHYSDISAVAEQALPVRYALYHLNTFVIGGDLDIYDSHNEDGELNLYDSQDPNSGGMTSQYLEDRSQFLVNLMRVRESKFSVKGDKIIFEDIATNTISQYDNAYGGPRKRFTFGSDVGELIGGEENHDHLYGGKGNDTLEGNGGNDYLEGNSGSDKLVGGEGNDELHGGRGNDGGKGDDGSEGIGGLFGGAGDDALYGGAGNDTLDGDADRDLLVGGYGRDTLIGGDGNDILYGDHRYFDEASNKYLLVDDGISDRLEGGLGDDLYFAGAGDVIRDTDGLGTVCINVTTGTGDQVYVKLGLYALRQAGSPNAYEEYNAYHDVTIQYTLAVDGTLTVRESGGAANSITIENFSDHRLGINVGENYNSPDWANPDYVSYWFHLYRSTEYTDEYNPWWPTATNLFEEARRLSPTYVYHWENGPAPEANVINGTDSDEAVNGGEYDDTIYGGAGADVITGNAGDDWLEGGEGNDELFGGDGTDCLYGGDGDDILDGGDGADYLNGGAGDDQLHGGDGDRLYGEEGSDTYFYAIGDGNVEIHNQGGPDPAYQDTLQFLEGIAPDDVTISRIESALCLTVEGSGVVMIQGYFTGWPEDHGSLDLIQFASGAQWDRTTIQDWVDQTGNGDDVLIGTDAADQLEGYGGDDRLEGRAGDDVLNGGSGVDRIYGESGNDTLSGDLGDDQLYGGVGNDILVGGDGNDWIEGGDGNDLLDGGAGFDMLFGEAGDDHLISGDGSNFEEQMLLGGEGDDTVYGDSGDDVINGNGGNDALVRLAGRDTLRGLGRAKFCEERIAA